MIRRFTTKGAGGYMHGPFSNGFIEPDGTFVEAEYQAYAKTTDPAQRRFVLEAAKPFGPSGAKGRGRQVKPLRPDHEEVKFPIMAFFVAKKFSDHPELAELLKETGQQMLVEGNDWHDNVWGDCECGKPACVAPGLNWLGQILMVVRATL